MFKQYRCDPGNDKTDDQRNNDCSQIGLLTVFLLQREMEGIDQIQEKQQDKIPVVEIALRQKGDASDLFQYR